MTNMYRGGGSRWVWPLILIVILVGLGLLAFAFLMPPTQAPQPVDQPAAVEPAPDFREMMPFVQTAPEWGGDIVPSMQPVPEPEAAAAPAQLGVSPAYDAEQYMVDSMPAVSGTEE